jgi:hypothetical protein
VGVRQHRTTPQSCLVAKGVIPMYNMTPAATVGAGGTSLLAVSQVAPLWIALAIVALIALGGAILRIVPRAQA